MNPFNELDNQLQPMQSLQLLLLFVFLSAYVAAIGGVFGPRGRVRASALAVLAAVGLCAVVTPWAVGALLVATSIGAVGVFVAATMLMCRALGLAGAVTRVRVAQPAAPALGAVEALRPHDPAPATAN